MYIIIIFYIYFSARRPSREECTAHGAGNTRTMPEIERNIPCPADAAGTGSAIENLWYVCSGSFCCFYFIMISISRGLA
jgi:hypothetical protein